jgi:methionyl-tRNA synthetase
MKKIYITTPIYYVNDKPHVGHAYTSIACDCLSRFYRMMGVEVFFLTGTDEHGLKIQQTAEKKNINIQTFVDDVSKNFQNLSKSLMLTNNSFIRTTSDEHKKGASFFWDSLVDKKQIYLDKYAGWYSVRDEAYYQEDEVIDGKAPSGSDVEWVEEPSYFFKLSDWQKPLLDFYNANPNFIKPLSRYNEVLRFVESGLRDLSVSRTSFTWGIKVPGDDKHVMYVWLDALVNYLSAIGYPNIKSENFKKFWPADFHIVGKDILRFHGVYWPAFLMAADLPLPKTLVAHGWWTVEKEKMSKSLGNVVDPNDVIAEFGLDQFRYFLLREVPFGNDGDFSRDSLISRINSDLANNFGNLINRVYSMVLKNFDGKVPRYFDISEDETILREKIFEITKVYKTHITSIEFSKGISSVIEIVSLVNKYIDTQEPWVLAKNNKNDRLSIVLRTSLESIRIISFLINPVCPQASLKILESLGLEESMLNLDESILNNFESLKEDLVINKIDLLFPKIDKKIS